LFLFVIPAKAGTQGALGSRLRGNDGSYFSTTNLPPETFSITPVSLV
jgi:hypothetical protein